MFVLQYVSEYPRRHHENDKNISFSDSCYTFI